MFRSKKNVTLYSNHITTARSKSHENCHSKLYTIKNNNSFTGMWKKSSNNNKAINKAYYLQEALNKLTNILFVHAYPLYLIIKGTLRQT